MTVPALDIEAMRAAAEAATPGMWRVGMTASDGSAAVTVSMPFHATTITCLICEIDHREADRVHVPALSVAECDAAHIAAWCPANAIAVLDMLRGVIRVVQDAYGMLWQIETADQRVHRARKLLLSLIDKDGRRGGIASTRPLECGHPLALAVISAETGDFLYCELCNTRSERNDAVAMEERFRVRAAAAEAALATERENVVRLREAIEPFARIRGYTCIGDEAKADVDFTKPVPRRNHAPYSILRAGDFRNAYAIGIWNRCLATGDWPGYPAEIVVPEFPSWAETRWLAREGAYEALGIRPALPPGAHDPKPLMEPV